MSDVKTNKDPQWVGHPDCTCGAKNKVHESYCKLSVPAWLRRANAKDLTGVRLA